MKTVIRMIDRHPVVRFAARELARYLRRATGKPVPIITTSGAPPRATVLSLGLFGAESDADHVRIEPEGRGYRLTGSNPRSVLFAVCPHDKTQYAAAIGNAVASLEDRKILFLDYSSDVLSPDDTCDGCHLNPGGAVALAIRFANDISSAGYG